jgi:hypothetical protein
MRGDRSLEYAVYLLADRLHKTVAEVRTMTVEEFNGWQAYSIVSEEKRKET